MKLNDRRVNIPSAVLKEGDEIIITIMEHHSNIVPWQMLRDLKGIKINVLGVDEKGDLKLEDLSRVL